MKLMDRNVDRVVVIGAGPAGLTAAYELDKLGVKSVVLEKDPVVGGISRTVSYKGYHFDIGGHRFFTKVDVVESMWKEVLADDLIRRKRLSRIYYDKRFLAYPLHAADTIRGLGLRNSALIALSYAYAQLFPIRNERTFKDWVTNRFGKRLYTTFFETYTEKVWGMRCDQISADWAAQRIKGLSLLTALKNSLRQTSTTTRKDQIVKTLIDSFHYPTRGPGMMWEKVAEKVEAGSCALRMSAEVDRILWAGDKVAAVEFNVGGQKETAEGTDFISSMPLRELVEKLDPRPPQEVLDAAAALRYRDFITVALIVNARDLFPDNWIYIHDPGVKVGRVQNFKNWSPSMVPDPEKTCIGLEYFCFEGDGLWTMPDEQLVKLGINEMQALGLVRAQDVEDGTVVRMPKAYPVYDETYMESLGKIRAFLRGIKNLQPVGRNGMHKYNNQDHSMLTAMLAVKNIMGAKYDLWLVNADEGYHEEVVADEAERYRDYTLLESTQPSVPVAAVRESALDEALIQAFARMDKLALGGAIGIVSGLYLTLATLFLVIKGGEMVGTNMMLLGQYFVGYTVTVKGAFVGCLYGFFSGFLMGWFIAYVRNVSLGFYLYYVKKEAEAETLRNFLNYI